MFLCIECRLVTIRPQRLVKLLSEVYGVRNTGVRLALFRKLGVRLAQFPNRLATCVLLQKASTVNEAK